MAAAAVLALDVPCCCAGARAVVVLQLQLATQLPRPPFSNTSRVPACPVQERRKFGSLGWNTSYAFNASDLECSSSTLHMLLSAAGPEDAVPWDALECVIGEVNYGGR
jgi:hypothetical protein